MPSIPVPTPTPTDGVVALRPWRMDDVDQMAAACVDPDIQRFTMVPADYTPETARTFIAGCAAGREEGTALSIAVVDADDDGRILGGVGLVRLDWPNERAEIGYWVAPGARGRGAATRAVTLLSRWALGELDLARLTLMAHVDNHASQRVAERAGYTREGVLRSYLKAKHGRVDVVMFSLTC